MNSKIKCDWCGKEFGRKRAHIHERNYCCRACLGKANSARFSAIRPQKQCDYCGKTFEFLGMHKLRNKHFFCCKECSYAFKDQKVIINCDWCGQPIFRKRADVARNKHYFCEKGCYQNFINFDKAGAKNQRIAGKVLYRILAELKIGRKLFPDEEVHHIDGNHLNNNRDNLQVVSASEHSKIHASQKRRDKFGKFIKQK